MTKTLTAWLAWTAAVAVTVLSAAATVADIVVNNPRNWVEAGSIVAWGLTPAVFAWSGALIVASQPRNVVGWLLMAPPILIQPAIFMNLRLDALEVAPTVLTPTLFFSLWYDNWSWLVLIFPLFHLLQVFPTGKPVSPRWRWLTWLEIAMATLMIVVSAVVQEMGQLDGGWTVSNPIGFVPASFFGDTFSFVWTIGLVTLAIGGAAAPVLRYRRAATRERQQIKWLLYAFSQFALTYATLAIVEDLTTSGPWDLIFNASILAIPVMIAIAVVRQGLFDIDVIIRRTLVYSLLTGLLALVYLGSVVTLRTLIGGVIGAGSSLSVAASTLLAAALFSPVRRRIQAVIDRRLYRRRYNAQQVIEDFADSLRDQTDIDRLSVGLVDVIAATVQPKSTGLWIRA